MKCVEVDPAVEVVVVVKVGAGVGIGMTILCDPLKSLCLWAPSIFWAMETVFISIFHKPQEKSNIRCMSIFLGPLHKELLGYLARVPQQPSNCGRGPTVDSSFISLSSELLDIFCISSIRWGV